MASIKSRLRRVEQRARRGSCPECGLPPDGPGRIVYDKRPEGSKEVCPRCGRRLWFVIEVDEGEGAYLASTCSATKRDGNPCTLPSKGMSGLCWAHDPANAERRRRGQSRGGKNRPSRELANIKDRLQELAEDVLTGEVDKGAAAVAGQLLNTYIRAVSVELKAKEQLELIERLEALEVTLERNQENRRYGA